MASLVWKANRFAQDEKMPWGIFETVCASRCRKTPYLRPSRHMLSKMAATELPPLLLSVSEAAPLETPDRTLLASSKKMSMTGNFLPFRLSRRRTTLPLVARA